jgi:uncharacterized iron-regulated membrane protein
MITLRLPNRAGAPAAFAISDSREWSPVMRSQLTLEVATSDVLHWQPYERASLAQRARTWVRFGHTGEVAGVAGQIVAGVGCVGGVVLVWTGLALAFRRLVHWQLWARWQRARRSAPDDSPAHTAATAPPPGAALE